MSRDCSQSFRAIRQGCEGKGIQSPVSDVEGLLPILQRQLEPHLLNEARQEIGKRDDELVDQLHRAAEVAPRLEKARLAQGRVDVPHAGLSATTESSDDTTAGVEGASH